MQEENKQPSGARALLFELRGQEPGVAHPLPRGVFRIGSNEDNDIVLRDRDVKPDQLEICFLQDRFVLKNLAIEGSVFLNGEPIEESTLQKGDILTVGESMFRYVDQGEALSQEELWRPVGGKRSIADTRKMPLRRISFFMVLALVALGSVLFILFTQGKKKDTEQPGVAGNLSDVNKPVEREELKVEYEHGKDLLAARRWDEAILIFEDIRKRSPNFMEVENLYQEALRESQCVDILNYGKGLVVENELLEARDQMEQIPKKSVYYREAERLAREIDDMILEQRIEKALAALARKDWSYATMEAESILAKYPNNKDARRIVLEARMLQRQITDKGAGVRTAWAPRGSAPAVPATETKQPDKVEPERKPTGSPKRPSKGVASSPGVATRGDAIQRALSAYHQGKTEQALSGLKKVSDGEMGSKAQKAREIMENLRIAMADFQQAKTLQREGRYAEAVDAWERFLETDRNIHGNRGGTYFRQASVSLTKIYYERGKKEFDRGNPIGAALFWKMGKDINPQDQDVQRGMDQLDEVARKIYREGYSLQEINLAEAIEKWREVLMILPSDHPYYKKAEKQLDRYAESP